jgi:hypothetical protein
MSNKKMALALVSLAGILVLGSCTNTNSSANGSSAGSSSAASTTPISSSVASTDVSILNGWQDNGDSVYTPTLANDQKSLTVAYDKAGATWASMKYSMGRVASQLEGYKKMVITFNVTDHEGAGPQTLLPKFEFNDSVAHPAHECKFQFSATQATYEWDLSGQVLTDALQLLVFVEPGAGAPKGNLVISNWYFSLDEVQTSGTTIVGESIVQVTNDYVSGDPFDVMSNLYDGGDFVYSFEKNAGILDVSYSKYGGDWNYFKNTNTNVSTFKYVNFIINGPTGKTMMIKAEGGTGGALEQTITFDGTDQDYTLYFLNKADRSGNESLTFFVEQGSTAVSAGNILFKKMEFSNTALVPEPAEIKNPFLGANPWDASSALANKWKDGGDGLYAITNEGGASTISWTNVDNVAHQWSSVQAPLSGDFEVFEALKINVTASVAMDLKFKVEGGVGVENDVSLAAATATDVVIDLSAKKPEIRSQMNKAIIFPVSQLGCVTTGSIVINSMAWTNRMAPVAGEDFYDALPGVCGDVAYSLSHTYADGLTSSLKIDWGATKGQWTWLGFALDSAVDYSAYKYINFHVSAMANVTNVFFKVNDAQEYKLTGITTEADVSVALSSDLNAAAKPFVSIIINSGENGLADSSITFDKLILSKTGAAAPIKNEFEGANAWDSSWALTSFASADSDKVALGKGLDDKITASWSDVAGQDWTYVGAPISGSSERGIFTKATFNLTSTVETSIIVKVQGVAGFAGVEDHMVFTAGALTQEITLDLAATNGTVSARGLSNFALFFPLCAETPAAAGMITINSVSLNSPVTPSLAGGVADCLPGLFGPSNYSFTRNVGSTQVDYTANKGEWEAMGFALDKAVDYSALTQFIVHVDGATSGIKLMFKINDAQEYKIDDLSVLTADFAFTLTAPVNAAAKPFVTCFVNYGATGAAGFVTISKLQLA